MAQPLTKLTRKGKLYIRPAPIEANIDGALAEDFATLEVRLQVTAPGVPDYLTSECLVHLIRDSNRRGDAKTRDQLVLALFARCELNLKSAVPDSRVSNAAELREEVLQEFALMLAADGLGDNPDELDYFECRFNQAFKTFRIDLLRSEQNHQNRCVPFPDESVLPDEEVPKILDETLSCRASQGDNLARDELLNALPPDIRKAVVLCYEMDYEVESEDSTKTTAATLCGVTGRTIRNRLRQAAAYLSKFKQEDL
jgi:hypothetical protein